MKWKDKITKEDILKKRIEEFNKCLKCGYQPVSLVDSVNHSIGCKMKEDKLTEEDIDSERIARLIDPANTFLKECKEVMKPIKKELRKR